MQGYKKTFIYVIAAIIMAVPLVFAPNAYSEDNRFLDRNSNLARGSNNGMGSPDYSRSYGFGGVMRSPDSLQQGSGPYQRPILDVNSGINMGGILGCSGLDIGGMLQNTFNLGNLGDEFKSYLQNTIATEALSLLYSQPGVAQVLDGMKAIGHARVSILQEKCNANEILADVTNKRLKDEGYAQCLDDSGGDAQFCDNPANLQAGIDKIIGSKRWSGTLHDQVCPEGSESGVCRFLPDFAYDIGSGQGKTGEAEIPVGVVSAVAENAAMECFEKREEMACKLISEKGYSEAMRLVQIGEEKIHCGANASSSSASSASASATTTPTAPSPSNGLSPIESCLVDAGEGVDIDTSDLGSALEESKNVNPVALVAAHTECLIGKEIHGHIDLNMCTLPSSEREGVKASLSQVMKTKASVDLYNALIMKLSEALIRSGGEESSNKDNSMNTHTLDFVTAQIEMFKNQRDSLITEMRLTEDVAGRVSAMIDEMDKNKAAGAAKGASAIGNVANTGSGQQNRADQIRFGSR